ncbi:MAG: leucine-rich repeat protein [Lachnospiraceae bacterium]|nr:leucine-rich repeat protein [Lachnospiraceae bacterium]
MVIPATVTTIGKEAFCGDKKLTSINIKGKLLTKIGKDAFKGVPKSCKTKTIKAKKSFYKALMQKAGYKGKMK